MTQQSNRDAWRKFLGISDARNGRADVRTGVGVGRSAGRASGAGSTDRDGNPEGEAGESAEKGNGALDAGKRLKTGDKGDRLTDLYDCETGEEVTIDGLGEKGTEAYPSGFDGCKDKTGVPPEGTPIYRANLFTYNASGGQWVQSEHKTGLSVKRNTLYGGYVSSGFSHIVGASPLECKSILLDALAIISASGFSQNNYTYYSNYQNQAGGACLSASSPRPNAAYFVANVSVVNNPTLAEREEAAANENPSWPAVDKNHLTWNKEKNCFEPLCPELNTQVLDKYKGCEDERILCDEDGNKVKVEIDGNTVKVTQEKYNQTAEIRNGKVTSVKALSESQTEAAFR